MVPGGSGKVFGILEETDGEIFVNLAIFWLIFFSIGTWKHSQRSSLFNIQSSLEWRPFNGKDLHLRVGWNILFSLIWIPTYSHLVYPYGRVPVCACLCLTGSFIRRRSGSKLAPQVIHAAYVVIKLGKRKNFNCQISPCRDWNGMGNQCGLLSTDGAGHTLVGRLHTICPR